jgi:hypothetical protein
MRCGYTPRPGTAPAKTAPILKNLKELQFFAVFLRWIKAKRITNHTVYCGNFTLKNVANEMRLCAATGDSPCKNRSGF